MDTHKKEYAEHAEFQKRFSIFRRNLHRIKQFQREERGSATYGITQYADMTGEYHLPTFIFDK